MAPDAAALQPWIGATAAAGQRRDVEAAMRREEAAAILQRNAVTELRSRLDLSASMFYTALGEVGDVATEDLDDERPPDLPPRRLRRGARSLGRPELHADAELREAARQQQRQGPPGRARGRAPHPRHRDRPTCAAQVRLNVARTASALVETIGRLKQTQAGVAVPTTRRSPRSCPASAPVRRR